MTWNKAQLNVRQASEWDLGAVAFVNGCTLNLLCSRGPSVPCSRTARHVRL
jgi:hypothetical protein